MTDKTEKIRTVREATERLQARVSDFQRKLDEEKSIAFLKRCKQQGLISTFIGDEDFEQE